MLTHATKYLSVSISLPLPTISGHQSSQSLLAVRAWQIQMTGSFPSYSRGEVW